MFVILYILFWGALLLLVHSYVLYPLLVSILARFKSTNQIRYSTDSNWPFVTVLMAAYNEEAILEAKIQSLLTQNYPSNKLKIYIGSDNSSDKTNSILNQYSSKDLVPVYFTSRQGKPSIINQLVDQALDERQAGSDHIFLMTDASVMLAEDTLTQLVQHFKNPRMGLVDAHMTYTGMKAEGISKSENKYLSSEVRLKQNEGKLWRKMIGPFGGCFAMRSELYEPVPSNFLVDDFYLALTVLAQDYQVINEVTAICTEPVSHLSSEEFRRKKRISTGNFQNLFHFKRLLNPFTSLGFAFISHKVIRWLGPFLMIIILISSTILAAVGSVFFMNVLMLQAVWYFMIPLLDKIFTFLNINVNPARHVSYFNLMNWALLRGFFSYVSGVESGIWQPTKRN